MKVVFGLGNPGLRYVKTRHNVGFMFMDYLGLTFKEDKNLQAHTAKVGNTLFVKPQTYMNLSGLCVQKVINYYKFNIEDIIVIHDDIYLEVGMTRIKKNSSDGGQNGIKDIIKTLKTKNFTRIKIGVGKNDQIPIADYVISKFHEHELQEVQKTFPRIEEILKDLGVNKCKED